MEKKLGIYVHVPFCLKKCNYCDFLSFGGLDQELHDSYVHALQRQIREYNEKDSQEFGDVTVDTVFIGGGTPSLLQPEAMEQIVRELGSSFQIDPNAEITIETNPKTLSGEKLQAYRDMGINRLSIGCQSTDDELLAFMGRAHRAKDFFDNFEQARACGFSNINVDLMFGIKGQTLETWANTLEQVLALNPEHLSFYSLQVEEGTPFFELHRQGGGCQCTDEENRQMYELALQRLQKHGLIHYEISNGAKPGFLCKHNLKYWEMRPYLGLGLGAHSYINGVRFENTGVLHDYLNGAVEPTAVHINDRKDELSDYIFTGLRKIEGIRAVEFEQRFGEPLEIVYGETIRRFTEEGLLFYDGTHLRFTRNGLDVTNTVLRELI